MTRRYAIPLFCLALLASAPSRAQMNVKKLADGVWASTTTNGANVGWFVDGEDVIAVDSGPNPQEARNILAKIKETAGKPVRFVIITHAHGDHAGGAGEFAAVAARVIASDNAAAPLMAAMQGAKVAPKAEFLAVATRLQGLGGTRRFEIDYLGPAHSDGDLLVALPDDKILFSGDVAVNGYPYMRGKGIDPRNWLRILISLQNLPFDQLVPGHGAIGPRDGLASSRSYVGRVLEIARKLAEEKVPDADLDRKLHEPENMIEKVAVTEEHVENIRAVYRFEKERLANVSPTPVPASKGR